jgi:hypothetical protein
MNSLIYSLVAYYHAPSPRHVISVHRRHLRRNGPLWFDQSHTRHTLSLEFPNTSIANLQLQCLWDHRKQ